MFASWTEESFWRAGSLLDMDISASLRAYSLTKLMPPRHITPVFVGSPNAPFRMLSIYTSQQAVTQVETICLHINLCMLTLLWRQIYTEKSGFLTFQENLTYSQAVDTRPSHFSRVGPGYETKWVQARNQQYACICEYIFVDCKAYIVVFHPVIVVEYQCCKLR